MTTIACDGKAMAGDGRELSGGTITGSKIRKVRRLADGRLVGAAGDFRDIVRFVEWLEQGGAAPKLKSLSALVLSPDGLTFYDEAAIPMPSEVPAAIGSGRDFALAAMDAGASPRMAVEVAVGRNPSTGGEIIELSL